MNHIYFNPATQFENTGDILINKVLVNYLGNHGRVYIEDNYKPQYFIEQLYNKENVLLSKQSNRSAKIIVISKLFKNLFSFNKSKEQYYYVLIPGHVEKKGSVAFKRQVKLLIYLILLDLLGCRVIRVGNSYGKFSKANKMLEAFSSRLIFRTAVRDTYSLKFAKESNFKNIALTPDLAWGYSINHQKNTETKGKYIVLSFRANAYGVSHSSEYIVPIIQRLKAIINKTNLSDFKIVIANQVKFDEGASKEIYVELSKNTQNIELIQHNLSLEEAYTLYKNAECLISNRLHVVLLGINAETLSIPLLNVSDNKKIVDVFTDNSLSDTIIDLEKDIENNTYIVSSLLANKNSIEERYKVQLTRNKQLLKEVFEDIFR